MKKNKTILLVGLLSILFVSYILFKPSGVEKKTLRVLTYSSFAGIYGPGRVIKKKFEAVCNCHLQWFLTEDSTALFKNFLLGPSVDIVIGWDQLNLAGGKDNLWEDISFFKKNIDFHFETDFLRSPFFLPIDWSPIGFISREKQKISQLKSLYKVQGRISFPEPHTSTLGLQFYYWIYESFKGNQKLMVKFLKKLKSLIYGPVFSWSLAYGFFQRGHTDMGLSYLSSLIYHHKEEPKKKYFFVNFEEGHPYQIEFLSISKKSKNKKLAEQLVEFLLLPETQKLIQDRHYMFPISKEVIDFLSLEDLKFISYKNLSQFIKNKKSLLELWEGILH